MVIEYQLINVQGMVELMVKLGNHLSIIIVVNDSGKPQWRTSDKITGLTFQKYQSTERQQRRTVPD